MVLNIYILSMRYINVFKIKAIEDRTGKTFELWFNWFNHDISKWHINKVKNKYFLVEMQNIRTCGSDHKNKVKIGFGGGVVSRV